MGKAIVAASIMAAGAAWWVLPAAPIRRPQPPAQKIQNVRVEATAPSLEAPRVAPALVPAEAVPTVTPLTQPARSIKARAVAPKPVPVENPSEMELIRRAEGLRAQPAQALRELNEHARLYPAGMLAQEREVLAIEALLAAGQRSAAEVRAAKLAATHPGSAHLRRVRVLLGAGTAE